MVWRAAGAHRKVRAQKESQPTRDRRRSPSILHSVHSLIHFQIHEKWLAKWQLSLLEIGQRRAPGARAARCSASAPFSAPLTVCGKLPQLRERASVRGHRLGAAL